MPPYPFAYSVSVLNRLLTDHCRLTTPLEFIENGVSASSLRLSSVPIIRLPLNGCKLPSLNFLYNARLVTVNAVRLVSLIDNICPLSSTDVFESFQII